LIFFPLLSKIQSESVGTRGGIKGGVELGIKGEGK